MIVFFRIPCYFDRERDTPDYISFSEKDGLKLEAEVNKEGPGEAYFVKCDVTKDDEIKVRNKYMFIWGERFPYNMVQYFLICISFSLDLHFLFFAKRD